MQSCSGINPSSDKTKEATQILRDASLRVTPCRTSLLDLLLRARDPLTQKELMASLEKRGFNRVTIYRALQTFLNVSIVHRIVTEDRVWRFAITLCGHRGQGHCHPAPWRPTSCVDPLRARGPAGSGQPDRSTHWSAPHNGFPRSQKQPSGKIPKY